MLFLVLLPVSMLHAQSITARKSHFPSTKDKTAEALVMESPEALQAEIMSFASNYAIVIGDEVEAIILKQDDPQVRLELKVVGLDTATNSLLIATGRNPVTGMLDMAVLVSLQDMAIRDYWLPRLGEDGDGLLAVSTTMYDDIWEIVGAHINAELQAELKELIANMHERYKGQYSASWLRASEFAANRGDSFVKVSEGGGLLGIFALDPMSNLTPATQEIARSRMLAERVVFYLQRLPTLLESHVDTVLMRTATMPEVVEVQAQVAELVEISDRAVVVMEAIKADLPAEREAAIDQLFAGVATEREAILTAFEANEEELSELVGELRQTMMAANSLNDGLPATIDAGTELVVALTEYSNARPKDAPPLKMTEVREVVEAASGTIGELNQTLVQLESLISSPEWKETREFASGALSENIANAHGLIDTIYSRTLTIVIIFIVGLILVVASQVAVIMWMRRTKKGS